MVAACALAARGAAAADVGSKVVDALRVHPRVRVVVALWDSTAPR